MDAPPEEKRFVVNNAISGLFIDEAFGFDSNDKNKTTKRLTINQRVTRVFGVQVFQDDDDEE